MAFILVDAKKVFPWEKTRMLVEFTLRESLSAKSLQVLSRVPGIFLYSFIIRSTNCYKIARAAIRALHVKDGFNYIHNIYANAR